MGESEAFMEDFGDELNDEADPYQAKNGRNAAETLDTSLQAPNANDFSNARLIEEVIIIEKRNRGNLELFVLQYRKSIEEMHDATDQALVHRGRVCDLLLMSDRPKMLSTPDIAHRSSRTGTPESVGSEIKTS